jgi:hypothetical protein
MNPPHQLQDTYRNSSPMIPYSNTYAPRLTPPHRPQPLYRPIVTTATSSCLF